MSFLQAPRVLAIIKKDPGPIPELKEPRGSIEAPSPDRIILSTALILAFIVLFLGRLLRGKPMNPPPLPEPIDATFRRQMANLTLLGNSPEAAAAASRAVRRYVQATYALGPGELTAWELCEQFRLQPGVDEVLHASLFDFLKECEVSRFAPDGAAGGTFEPVPRALEFFERLQTTRMPMIPVTKEPTEVVAS